MIPFDFKPKLDAGQYLLAGKAQADKTTILLAHPVFVEPAPLGNIGADSRFGLNASQPSLAREHHQLGIGWVRFENFKWPMVSPAPHQYAFDGTVKPWEVNLDAITHDYREAGLNILPMMFLTPRWASGAGKAVPEGMRLSQPPKNPADFGEFVFQSVARYGSTKVDADQLKTKDKVSGLDRIRYFELGNEPNLNPLRDKAKPPTWAPGRAQWISGGRCGGSAQKPSDGPIRKRSLSVPALPDARPKSWTRCASTSTPTANARSIT